MLWTQGSRTCGNVIAGQERLGKITGSNNALSCLRLQFHMLRFVCDYCESVKQPSETWINGVAAENVGTQAARREVIIDPTWRRERAVAPFAVHFCSVECKDNYLAELFHKPAQLLEIESTRVEPGRRIVHAEKRTIQADARKRTSTIRRSRAKVGKSKA